MKKLIIVLMIFMISAPIIYPQKKSDAHIIGHVISNGEHIPFATVSLEGTTIGVTTDETGHFRLTNIPPGTYSLRVQCVGYKHKSETVSINNNETLEVNFDIEEDILGLDEIVVTANRGEIKRVESLSIVNTISTKLFTSSQAVTLSEGLFFTPGIRIENNCQNCGFTQVRMNGMEGPYSQILINSRPIFSGLAGVYGLELIPATMVEKVEVIRGGGSALYGGNAIAGTINIILKEPETNSYEIAFNTNLTGVGLEGTGGTAPDYSLNFNTSMTSDDNKTGIALYGFTRSRDMFDANGDGFSEISSMENLTIGTRFYHRIGTRGKITFDFFNITEERDGGNKQDYPEHERDLSESVDHDIKTAALTFEKYFRKNDMLSVFVSTQRLVRDSYYGALKSLSNYGNTRDLTYNTGIQYKADFDLGTLIAGIENTGGFLVDKKMGYPDLDVAVINDGSIVEIPHTENTVVSDQSSITSGVFLQYDLKINKLKIGVGGRVDHYTVTDKSLENSVKSGNVFSPRLSFMYEIVKSLQARISYSQGYRAPQIFDEDLHIETSGSRKVFHENDPELKQETSRSLMASIDFNKLIGTTTTGLLIEGFYTKLEDPFINEIGLPDANGEVIYTRRNSEGGAVVKGANIELKVKPLQKFYLISGFTMQSSLYDTPHEFNTKKFFRTPSNYGYMNLDWDFIENFCLSVTGTYTGNMYVPYFGIYTDPDLGELRRTDPFWDVGAKLTYNIKINGATVQLFAGAKNIANSYQKDFDTGVDRDPSYVYGPISPRSIYFGVKIGNKL